MARRAPSRIATIGTLCCALCIAAIGGADGERLPERQSPETVPASLEELMQLFASGGAVRARFHETKHLSILDAPLESEGLLYFAPPDRLARHVERPARSSVVLDGDEILISEEAGRRAFELGPSRIAQQFMGDVRAVVGGDLVALRKRYSVDFHAGGGDWILDLEPRSRTVRRVIEKVRFAGHGRELTRMETMETGGDRTVTVFSEVQAGLELGPDEIKRIFSVDELDDGR